MEIRSIEFNYAFVSKGSLLDTPQKELLNAALQATSNAYAPYSQFYVGSAILLENNQIISGLNQENASYPCGICAERAVLYHYGNLQLKLKITKMAVTVANKNLKNLYPIAPCGLCRQVMCEFEQNNGSPIELILGHPEHESIIIPEINKLLPFVFNSDYLFKTV